MASTAGGCLAVSEGVLDGREKGVDAPISLSIGFGAQEDLSFEESAYGIELERIDHVDGR